MAGTVGGMRALGNTNLKDYGIQTDKSDIRAHVGALAKKIYVFKTRSGGDAIDQQRYRLLPVYTGNIKTAEGYCVPWQDIESCQEIPVPPPIFQESKIDTYPEKGWQSAKGKAAVFIVREMLKLGLLPLTLDITEVNEKTMQIKGEDIKVQANITIQVKCDYRAGQGHPRCTGNLFLQVKECNPFKIY